MNLESRVVASEDIGRHILTYRERKLLEDLLKAEDAILISVEGSNNHVKWEELLVELTWVLWVTAMWDFADKLGTKPTISWGFA
ncbi:hypothetical protein Nepgr_001221 [Nepenthes gracilis]|uniref:Uncharacterized protein n=1 Tax=Nepenthes gracilis TaxID=150966 RepID=A0AAD3P4W7_NEPGR|nr:hypothetical protein Nepgr_001221 [Nepenthes gracilis]